MTSRTSASSRWLFNPAGEASTSAPTADPAPTRRVEKELVALALALGARNVRGWSSQEEALGEALPPVAPEAVAQVARKIQNGHDPLGEIFLALRAPPERRTHGATYTPLPIVRAMVERVSDIATPVRVVDPGTGSGRYIVAAGRRFRQAALIGVELDPVAAIMARATLAAAGFADRSQVILSDYRQFALPPIDGRTLYVGNPPYVRHHLLEQTWKQWLISEAAKRGLAASQLAGLHVHFFLATVVKAARGDFGAFITSAEWLDVNYGSLVRQLFLGPLGGKRIVVIEPTAQPFPDAATTAAITYFEIGSHPQSVKLKRVERADQVAEPNGGRAVLRERLENETRWSHLTRAARGAPKGFIELGELCRVHRGQVTGANRVWIAGSHSESLPSSVLFPTVTKAKELFNAGAELSDASTLRRVIDLPVDLDILDRAVRGVVEKFLAWAKELGANLGYVAQNRKAWWSVGLRQPAPILATYMARRPPAFVRNLAEARHINIAHGLYPREALSDDVLNDLADFLTKSTCVTDGRTYAGGLTKFEPREMERLMVPGPEILGQGAFL